jgi:hypothetical protein
MSDLFADIFAISEAIRYVAVGQGQDVELRQREGLRDASSSDSDRFEELLVNPTLLKLAMQRGDIDCGGLRYLIVGYGHFHQLVLPLNAGHLSVAFELDANPADHIGAILQAVRRSAGRRGNRWETPSTGAPASWGGDSHTKRGR